MVRLLHLLEVVEFAGKFKQLAVSLHESVLLHEEAPVRKHVHHSALVVIRAPVIL